MAIHWRQYGHRAWPTTSPTINRRWPAFLVRRVYLDFFHNFSDFICRASSAQTCSQWGAWHRYAVLAQSFPSWRLLFLQEAPIHLVVPTALRTAMFFQKHEGKVYVPGTRLYRVGLLIWSNLMTIHLAGTSILSCRVNTYPCLPP